MQRRHTICSSTLASREINLGSVIVSEGSIPLGIPIFPRVVDEAWHLDRADRQRIYPRLYIRVPVQNSKELSEKTYIIVVPEEVCIETWRYLGKGSIEQGDIYRRVLLTA